MWKAFLQMLMNLFGSSRTTNPAEQSLARQRERFWAELHEGEREAKSRSRL
jgi:hypothetical protein